MDGVVVRPALEADLEDLAEIHACAYPEPGGNDLHARRLTHNAFGGLECVRAAQRDCTVVGLAALYPLEVWLGGRRVPAFGIGSLAVAPEARRQGVARTMLGALHAEIASKAGALALLYPFQQRFYARHGYGPTSPLVTLRIAVDAIARLPSIGAAYTTVRLEGARVHEARALYETVGPRTSGRVVRAESRWLKLFAREHRHWLGVVSEQGRLEGYMSFSYEGRSSDQAFVVHELTAADSASRGALLRACASQRDQIADVVFTIPYGDPLALAFEDATGTRVDSDVSDPIGTLSAGPMVRIVDPGRALGARGYASDGELTFACTDETTLQPVRLSVRENTARAAHVNASPDVELSSATLASIVAAGMSPVEAAELGLLHAKPAALRLAEQMFAGPRFQCLDPF
jgi:predicted acetyltransferase